MDLVKNYKSFNYRVRLEDVWRYCPPVETEKISDSSAHVAGSILLTCATLLTLYSREKDSHGTSD